MLLYSSSAAADEKHDSADDDNDGEEEEDVFDEQEQVETGNVCTVILYSCNQNHVNKHIYVYGTKLIIQTRVWATPEASA